MLNVYFFKIRFFYLRKIDFFERNFDIRLKNGTVLVTSSMERKDQKIQSGLNCHYAGLHIA